MNDARVTLHIDRLVLRGIDPLDQRALTDGLKRELARVLGTPAARSVMPQSKRTPVLKLGRMAMQPGQAGARAFGSGVARAIGKGMRP